MVVGPEPHRASPFLDVAQAGDGVLELPRDLNDAVGIAARAHLPVVFSDDLLRRLAPP